MSLLAIDGEQACPPHRDQQRNHGQKDGRHQAKPAANRMTDASSRLFIDLVVPGQVLACGVASDRLGLLRRAYCPRLHLAKKQLQSRPIRGQPQPTAPHRRANALQASGRGKTMGF